MKQYNQIKGKYPDALLLFRVGDFYETFGQDAVKASKILGIILTKRGAGSTSETELAGFPHHSLQTYLPKLVKAGERVAICDQLEDPKMTKTIVKRGVTELITPGVALSDGVLDDKTNNFLGALYKGKNNYGVSFLDISTGEFLTSQGSQEYIDTLLQNFAPKEVLVSKQWKKQIAQDFNSPYPFFFLEDWVFQQDYTSEKLHAHFDVVSLKGFGVENLLEGKIASGAVLHYLSETQHSNLSHITKIQPIIYDDAVWMDRFTMRNLELLAPNSPQAVTLLDVIDHTSSPMGGRMLKRWISLPLKNKSQIEKRHQAVSYWVEAPGMCQQTQHSIKKMGDLERLVSKVATAKVSPREVNHLKNSLDEISPIKALLSKTGNASLESIGEALFLCDELRLLIDKTLQEEAPVLLSKGNAIAEGVSQELDDLRAISQGGKSYLDEMLARETERTGIPSLKIAFNNVFGYYLEVRNTHKDKVPEEWIRKQTLVSAERYITEELKEYESKILGAEEKIAALEQALFTQLITSIQPYIGQILQNAQQLATLDCLIGFAVLAQRNQYCCPLLTDRFSLEIIQGRHPVIEKQLPLETPYIANDVYLDRDEQQIIMITGPNMSGKSAILRQTALIVLLAQIGSFVPAERAEIGVVDKIFTRVGASDNISMGESTFMVEMNETASILNNISERSLVLLDEIGRGTSTYDGVSIAWAITEYLHEHPARPKTLFATHYHELNQLAETFSRIKNHNVSVKETKDSVLFLRKLVPGGSAHSFGIHVAKMAGMPRQVLDKSRQILKKLERNRDQNTTTENALQNVSDDLQLSIFQLDDPLLETIRDEILATDIDSLTPIEALMKLNEIKRILLNAKNS
ncbi:MAG: DNA mismatch repair protein MutS [Flavobacteriaceae bacterium]|nr:DNA mismatch repair protein MutS [Flavobacteriaceae bacterium]MDG2314270.1 DNA mismatch repair protein MutS [Flavobacteriaceae bacterium]